MDTISHDLSWYLLQEELKKIMDVVWVLSGVTVEDVELKVGLICQSRVILWDLYQEILVSVEYHNLIFLF